jgi:hypothetical protein
MRTRIPVMAALIVLALTAPSVAAAPPGPANDEPSGATAVTSIPFSTTQATSKATANSADAGCGAGGQDQATVWYTLTLASATRVLVDTTGSSYFAGVNVFTAGPGSEILTCLGPAAPFDAAAGQTYYIMIADIDGGRNGGRLVVTIGAGPPALELGVSIDPTVTLDSSSGELSISGTATCNQSTDFLDVNVEASQSNGRFITRGFGGTPVDCTGGEPVAWSVVVVGETGTFGTGSTTINADVFGCDPFTCDDATASQTVRVRK